MPIPRQEVIDNPIPTSLFISDIYAVVLLFVDTGDAICGQMTTPFKQKNKDVGMELSMTSCLGIGIFLFPSFS